MDLERVEAGDSILDAIVAVRDVGGIVGGGVLKFETRKFGAMTCIEPRYGGAYLRRR